MALRDFLLGTPGRAEQVQRFNPEQQQAFSQILQQALSGLQQPTAGFEPIAQQARTQFQQQTVPSLAERFTAMGGQGSSAFGQQLGQAASGLEQGLASQQAQYGLQRGNQLQQLLGMGLAPQFDTIQFDQQPGFLETGIARPFLQGLGQALPGIASGGASSLLTVLSKILSGANKGPQSQTQQAAGGAPTYQPYQSPSFNNLQMLLGGRI